MPALLPYITKLYLKPAKEYGEATIRGLTPDLIDHHIMEEWWSHEDLKADYPAQIDRYWNWNDLSIEYHGVPLPSIKVGIFSGEELEGAMMISTEPVDCVLTEGKQCLFVELLFTAPRNRPELRRDGQPYIVAVGTELLTWGALLSRSKGLEGRLRLDGSPDFIKWYQNRGLQLLDLEPIVYQGVRYSPMELPEAAARSLLGKWGI